VKVKWHLSNKQVYAALQVVDSRHLYWKPSAAAAPMTQQVGLLTCWSSSCCVPRAHHTLQVYLDMLLEPLPAEDTWSKRLMQVGFKPLQPASQGAKPLCW